MREKIENIVRAGFITCAIIAGSLGYNLAIEKHQQLEELGKNIPEIESVRKAIEDAYTPRIMGFEFTALTVVAGGLYLARGKRS